MSDEPIYRQVQRDLEGRANSGKEQYGEHLTADTKIDGLQYLYEELLDGANYIRKAMEDRRALLEYVARLEGALRDIHNTASRTLAEPTTDTAMLLNTCDLVEDILATTPLVGPAPLPAPPQEGE